MMSKTHNILTHTSSKKPRKFFVAALLFAQLAFIAPAQADDGNTSIISGLISKAKTLIGTPYRFGGVGPGGFDCSGFMQYVFKKSADIDLPRTSSDMATMGEKVAKADLQQGDMVFFAHNGSRISHVGMYVGDGKFIHSPSTGKSVEIVNLDSKYWKSRFITARRVVQL